MSAFPGAPQLLKGTIAQPYLSEPAGRDPDCGESFRRDPGVPRGDFRVADDPEPQDGNPKGRRHEQGYDRDAGARSLPETPAQAGRSDS